MAAVVLDASVVLKWFLADEEDRDHAIGLRDAIVRGDLDPFAPSYLALEVAAGLVRASRRGRVDPDVVLPSLDALSQMGIGIEDIASVASSAASIALNLGLSVYDAAYLAVAAKVDAALVTADVNVHRVAAEAGHDVVLLTELPIEP